MTWPWSKDRRSPAARQKAEDDTDDVRIEMRALTEELKKNVDRLERIAARLEEGADGSDT